MNFQFFVEKLVESDEFRKFKDENKDAYPVGGFFSFDVENAGKENKYSLDYFIPSHKKLVSFKLEQGIEMVPVTIQNDQKFEEIGANYDFDFKDFEELIRKKMETEKINAKVQKILYSLQNLDRKDYLVGTVFISGFGIIQTNIEIAKKEIVKFERKSFLDFLRITKK